MKTTISILIVIICFILSTCKDDPVTKINNEEKILTLIYTRNLQSPAPYGRYYNTKLTLDTTHAFYQKRLAIDSAGNDLPDVDTLFIITQTQWLKIISSFNMDSVLHLDSIYKTEAPEAAKLTLEIKSNQRYKKIIYYDGYEFLEGNPLQQIDSLNKLINQLREGL